ncbi:MAG: glycoside hydrolase family 92 protein [Micropruina sp.]|uniref:glycoside hydrolase domain-containing protein n=1 Tax=Micropruina sp. TaxID=2737536 RepID=UPI0039E6C249
MNATVVPDPGPLDPPSSRPRAGVLGGETLCFSYRPADGVAVVRVDPVIPVIPAEAGVSPLSPAAAATIGPHTELHWAFYADDEAALRPPWASLAVCPDVVFDDGSRLSDGVPGRGPAIDRYGFVVAPDAQFAAGWSMPQQWNADAVSLAPWAGRRVQAIEIVLGDESLTAGAEPEDIVRGWVEVLLVERPEPEPESPAERVDTRRGSHAGFRFSRGNTIPAVARPHGFVFLTPATSAADTRWPYRWGVHDEPAGRRLEAIQTSHQPSPWIGDHGVLQFVPGVGGPADSPVRGGHIVPGSEIAQPHRYAAELAEGIAVEATAARSVAVVRLRGAGGVRLVLDQPDGHGSLRLTRLADGRARLEGWTGERPHTAWGNAPRMYLYGETAGAVTPADSGRPDGLGSGLSAPGEVEVRVATSFLSVEQARRTFGLEASWERDFETLVADARVLWGAVCGAVEATPRPDDRYALADRELRATLAHALYRLQLYPNAAAENAGTAATPQWRFADVFAPSGPHGDAVTGAPVTAGELVVNNGYWDSYRTTWPLLALLDADATGALLDGQLEQVRRGGWTARWSGPGYVDCMVGTSSDQIYAQASRLGVPGFDRALAYESGWRNACEPSPDSRTGRAGTASSRFTGFVPREIHAGLSWTIEAAISDAALARFADLLADDPVEETDAARYRAHARYFANRSLSYRQLFDPATGFFRGRSAAGRACRDLGVGECGQPPAGQGDPGAPDRFDPAIWGGDYVETNAWGMSASAVHDGAGLAALFGGPEQLRRHLDRLFAEPETIAAPYHPDQVIHEQLEARAQRSGMCALSNQPAHHLPFMYLHTDQPWRAAPLARALAGRLFTGGQIGQGFPGDEDNGEMSGWWLWALLGLYPLDPGSAELVVGVPLVDEVTLRRDRGELRVRVRPESAGGEYLAAARWNGQELARPVLTASELAEPGLLEIDLVDEPPVDAPLWRTPATAVAPWRPDLCRGGNAIASPGVDGRVVVDDGADPDGCCPLASGDWVGQDFGTPHQVTDLTVTTLDAAAGDWFTVEHSDNGLSWREASTTHREPLPANRTTPFQLAIPTSARYWRLRAVTPVRLRQLELFDWTLVDEVVDRIGVTLVTE